MHKLICDFCGKEITGYGALTKVTIERAYSCLGTPKEEEMHFHTECATRLSNKFDEFTAKARKEWDEE